MLINRAQAAQRPSSPAAGSAVRNERSCMRSGATICCGAVSPLQLPFCLPPSMNLTTRNSYFNMLSIADAKRSFNVAVAIEVFGLRGACIKHGRTATKVL